MAGSSDACGLCGTTLDAENKPGEGLPDLRMPCPNPDCPGKWGATEPGGEGGVRPSYDVPGLTGADAAD